MQKDKGVKCIHTMGVKTATFTTWDRVNDKWIKIERELEIRPNYDPKEKCFYCGEDHHTMMKTDGWWMCARCEWKNSNGNTDYEAGIILGQEYCYSVGDSKGRYAMFNLKQLVPDIYFKGTKRTETCHHCKRKVSKEALPYHWNRGVKNSWEK